MFAPPDPGMNQRNYSENELEEVIDFVQETTAYSSPRQRIFFIVDKTKENSETPLPFEWFPRPREPREEGFR